MLHRWPISYTYFPSHVCQVFIAILSVNNYYGVTKTSKSVIRMSKKFGNDTYSIRDLSTNRLTPERFVLYSLFNDPLYFFFQPGKLFNIVSDNTLVIIPPGSGLHQTTKLMSTQGH